MATKEELQQQNEELQAEIEELRTRENMETDVWNGRLPSPRENRTRVQQRLKYEQAATPGLSEKQKDSSSVAGEVKKEVEEEAKKVKFS